MYWIEKLDRNDDDEFDLADVYAYYAANPSYWAARTRY